MTQNNQQHKLYYQNQLPNQMVTAVVVLDNKLTVQYANPAAEALLVKSFNKLFNAHLDTIFINHPINTTRLEQLLTSGQEFSDSDVSLEFFDRRKVSVEITASSVEFDSSPHILIEFKQIDQQKKMSSESFQQQQWESGRFLIKGLAHEIKNPLGGLRGAAQLLSREINADQQEYTQIIIEQADRLTNLVDRLLGPNNLLKLSLQNIHLVLEQIFNLVSCDNPKNIILIKDYDPSIPDMYFDADKLQQAMLNIVNNAIQVLEPQGKIILKTRAANNKIINGKRVKLSVLISIVDDGLGIPDHIQDTLFYPMVSGRANGTGLGLSIAQTLVNQHGGKLSCISHPGFTEFKILLPINQELAP